MKIVRRVLEVLGLATAMLACFMVWSAVSQHDAQFFVPAALFTIATVELFACAWMVREMSA